MLNNILAFSTLVSIWFSLLASLVTLYGAIRFWIKHSKKIVSITPLKRYPTITIVVPAHNEELVIAKTTKGKGVSFMENQVGWHGKAPNDEEYEIAMADLEKAGEALCQK